MHVPQSMKIYIIRQLKNFLLVLKIILDDEIFKKIIRTGKAMANKGAR